MSAHVLLNLLNKLKKNNKMRSLSSILSPEQLQSYQASIQFWAIIGTPAKRHLNGVSLAGR